MTTTTTALIPSSNSATEDASVWAFALVNTRIDGEERNLGKRYDEMPRRPNITGLEREGFVKQWAEWAGTATTPEALQYIGEMVDDEILDPATAYGVSRAIAEGIKAKAERSKQKGPKVNQGGGLYWIGAEFGCRSAKGHVTLHQLACIIKHIFQVVGLIDEAKASAELRKIETTPKPTERNPEPKAYYRWDLGGLTLSGKCDKDSAEGDAQKALEGLEADRKILALAASALAALTD